MKTLIYTRVATDNQNSQSIKLQQKEIINYCDKNHLKITKIYSEMLSGLDKSIILEKIVNEIKDSEEKVILCVYDISRISRNMFDKNFNQIHELIMENKLELHIVSINKVIGDKTSNADKFIFGMNVGLARYYSDVISNNIKRAFEQKRMNGEFIGKAPYGYLSIKNKDGKRELIKDKEKEKIIKDVFYLDDKNLSKSEILKKIREKYPNHIIEAHNKVDKFLVYKILKNENFYKGFMMYNEKNYPHKYERILLQCKEK